MFIRAVMRPGRTDCRRGRADFWSKRVRLTRQMSGLKGQILGLIDERKNEWKNKSPHVFYRTRSPLGPVPKKSRKKAHSLSPKKNLSKAT